MNKEEIKALVCKKLANDLNWNEMQIRQETITDITNACGTLQPCIIAMQPVVDWFNSHKLENKSRGRTRALCGCAHQSDLAPCCKRYCRYDAELGTQRYGIENINFNTFKDYSIMKKAITYSLAALAFVGVAVLLFSTIGVAVFFLPLLAGAFK